MKSMARSAKRLIPVVLGSDVNAYGIARSFYEEYGVSSVIICKKLWAPCKNTKYISRTIVKSNIEDDDIFLEILDGLEKSLPAFSNDLVLLPCGDSYSELISRNKKTLESRFLFNTVDYKLHRQLNRKQTYYELCEKYGLAYPTTRVVSKNNFRSSIKDLVFPLVIKPTNSIMYWATSFKGKRKVFMVRDETEYKKVLDAIYGSSYDDGLIVQEYIPGEREAEFHLYSDQQGSVRFMQFDEMILGSPTPDGIGSHTAETVAKEPELTAEYRIFLNEIGYRGYGNIDFKFDPRDKKWKTFEINLRPARCSYAMTAAGHNLAKFIVDDIIKNQQKKFTVSKDPILYTLIPNVLLKKYAPKVWLSKIDELLASEQVVRHYLPRDDINVRRVIDYGRDQYSYFGKYRKYHGKSMITDI